MATKDKSRKKMSPFVQAALSSVPQTMNMVEAGQVNWGSYTAALSVLIPTERSVVHTPRDAISSMSLYPISASEVLQHIKSVYQAEQEHIDRAKKKGRDISGSLAMRARTARKAQDLIAYGKGAFLSQFTSMSICANEKAANVAKERLIERGGKYTLPLHGWVHALQSALPTSPPKPFTDPKVFFVTTPEIVESTMPVPRLPRLPEITGNPQFYIGITQEGEMLTWSPWDSTNPLLGISGVSGSGKSVLGRLVMYQAATVEGIRMVVLDPKGEWANQFRHFPPKMREKITTISTSDLFKHSIPQPHALISMMSRGEIGDAQRLSSMMSLLSGFASQEYNASLRQTLSTLISEEEWEEITWAKIYENLPEKAKEPFAILDPKGAFKRFFNGDNPLPIAEKGVTVIEMEHLTGSSSGDKETNDATTTLILLAIVENLKNAERGFFFVDEAHFLLKLPNAGDSIRVLMRVARSYKVAVALASQYLKDLYESTAAEESLGGQCAYRALLRPSDQETPRIDEFGLSKYKRQINTLMQSRPGSGLWFTGGVARPFFTMLPNAVRDFCLA
jgi:hypothetical protein